MEARTEAFLQNLYSAHYEKLIKTAFRMMGDLESAQDLVQQVFLLALLQKGKLIVHPVPEGWLVVALHNLVKQERKRGANHKIVPIDEIMEPAAQDAPLPMDLILPAELSPEERKILIWRFDQQMEYEEMADHLGISASSCRSRVSRAVANCRKHMKDP